MSTHKHFDIICVVLIVLAVAFSALYMKAAQTEILNTTDSGRDTVTYFTERQMESEWDTQDATVITLMQTDAQISGGGASYTDGTLTISQAGDYVISGALENGKISVSADKKSDIRILLNGVELSCEDDACFRVEKAKEVILTLAEGTENRMDSGTVYTEEALADGTDGAIYAHDDLTINGKGALQVTAAYRHGIVAKDNLVIAGADISVTAPGDAIHANDSMRIADATIALEAGDDGIAVADYEGYLYIQYGHLAITSADDAIHATDQITIESGEINIAAGDDGIHSDAAIIINDGTILIEKAFEGIEAPIITFNGGDTTIYPLDDGLNATGYPNVFVQSITIVDHHLGILGEDLTVMPTITINDGKLTIINEFGQDADGIDSNGELFVNGGEILVSMTGVGTNDAMDYASEYHGNGSIYGGRFIAAGAWNLAVYFDEGSTQPSLAYINKLEDIPAGADVKLKNAAGDTILSGTMPTSFQSIILSCPEMEIGGEYILQINDMVEEVTLTAPTTYDRHE